MKHKITVIVAALLIFVLALGITLYPLISNYVNQKYASTIYTKYEEMIQNVDESTRENPWYELFHRNRLWRSDSD